MAKRKQKGGAPVGVGGSKPGGQTGALVRRAISDGLRAFQTGRPDEATKSLFSAWNLDPNNLKALQKIGDIFIEFGARDEVMELLGDAGRRHGNNEQVFEIMGRLATRMNMPEIAEEAYHSAINCNPTEPQHYARAASAMAVNGKVTEAISLLQNVIPLHPENAGLWNTVGTISSTYLQEHEAAIKMYIAALEIDPKHANSWANLAALTHNKSDAEERYRQAIKLEPKNPLTKFHLSIHLLNQGKLKEGFALYENRLNTNVSNLKAVKHTHGLKTWKGQNLTGKSIFITAEQGIGDEIFFFINLDRLYAEAEQLYIGCDPRLVEVLKVSYPKAQVEGFVGTAQSGFHYRSYPEIEADLKAKKIRIDFSIAAGSVMQFFWKAIADIPSVTDGYLHAPSHRVTEIQEQLTPLSDKPLVGLSWRSGNLEGVRQFAYGRLSDFFALKDVEAVNFICLQYSHTDAEIRELRAAGVNIHVLEGIDLREDLEANFAIMAQLDLVIGPNTATQMMALASWAEAWSISWGLPWWDFGVGGEGPSFAPKVKWYNSPKTEDHPQVLVDIANALQVRYGSV